MDCFGFYNVKHHRCSSVCIMRGRCKSVTVAHGYTILADVLEHLVGEVDGEVKVKVVTRNYHSSQESLIQAETLVKSLLKNLSKKSGSVPSLQDQAAEQLLDLLEDP